MNLQDEVLKLLHASKSPEGHLQYLLLTDGGIFSLALQREKSSPASCRSRWVLNYRVKDEPAQDQDSPAFPASGIEKEGCFL